LKNIAWGLVLWISATALFRLFGQFFLDPSKSLPIVLTFFFTIPLIAVSVLPFYYLRKIPELKRLQSAVLIALPGMILDVLSLIYFDIVFPNLTTASQPIFAAWLLWAYSLILISGFPIQYKRRLNTNNNHGRTP
jgi:RsiW-degrading membrane proteinase PrsW (M82 family)